MKIYNEQIALQSLIRREVFNITTQVKAAVEKSGLREGIAVVSLLQAKTSIFIDDEGGHFDDIVSHLTEESVLKGQVGGGLGVPSAFVQHQVTVPFSEGRLDLGTHQAILFLELDGVRPRRIVVKVLGE